MRPPSGKKRRIPKPAHLGVGARSSHSGSARRTAARWGKFPNLYLTTSPARNGAESPRPVDVFSLPDLRYAPPPPPLEDITFIFQYVVNDTLLGTLARAG